MNASSAWQMYVLVKCTKLGEGVKNPKNHLAVKNLLAREVPPCHTACQVEEQLLDISCLRGLNTETVSKYVVGKGAHPSKMFLCTGSEPCPLQGVEVSLLVHWKVEGWKQSYCFCHWRGDCFYKEINPCISFLSDLVLHSHLSFYCIQNYLMAHLR